MYNKFYNLKEDPFRLTPDPAFLYMTVRHREALAGLVYSVCNRSGLTVMVGEAGTGKTTLLHALKEWLAKRQFITAFCTNPTLNREEFFDLLLAQLDVTCSSSLKSRQLMALEEALVRNQVQGRRAVVIIDEAQRLPRELLEEIRLLLNLESPKEKFLDIILAGQPELTQVLGRPELRQLKQRVSGYCRLAPLTQEEVREYVNHRLSQAGLPEQRLFPDDTMDILYECTNGIPRLVSSLCDSALQTGFALQSPCVTVPILREAAKDLDLLQCDEPETHRNGDRAMSVAAAAAAVSAVSTQPVTIHPSDGANEQAVASMRIPLESYATRQKSLGFFANLIGRWT